MMRTSSFAEQVAAAGLYAFARWSRAEVHPLGVA
jgi:hypothetical protein